MTLLADFDAGIAQARAAMLASIALNQASAPAPAPAPAAPSMSSGVFAESWEPRAAATGVYGVVASPPLAPSPDGSDPDQVFIVDAVTGKWGTILGLDGAIYDVTGQGGPYWACAWNAALGCNVWNFHSVRPLNNATDGFPIISKQRFDRSKYLLLKAPMCLAAGPVGSFLGMCLIAGEGDYREISIRRDADGDKVVITAPRYEEVLCACPPGVNEFQLHHVPGVGWGYFLNGQWLKTEPMAHLKAALVADPHIGIYTASGVPGSFSEGFVGPMTCNVA